jgi:hypothetical protein
MTCYKPRKNLGLVTTGGFTLFAVAVGLDGRFFPGIGGGGGGPPLPGIGGGGGGGGGGRGGMTLGVARFVWR